MRVSSDSKACVGEVKKSLKKTQLFFGGAVEAAYIGGNQRFVAEHFSQQVAVDGNIYRVIVVRGEAHSDRFPFVWRGVVAPRLHSSIDSRVSR